MEITQFISLPVQLCLPPPNDVLIVYVSTISFSITIVIALQPVKIELFITAVVRILNPTYCFGLIFIAYILLPEHSSSDYTHTCHSILTV
jgi:hypothetical protein